MPLGIYRSVTAPDGVPEHVARTIRAGDPLAAAGGVAFGLFLIAAVGLLAAVIPTMLIVVSLGAVAWLVELLSGVRVAVITDAGFFATLAVVYGGYVLYSVGQFARSVRDCLDSL
ncbi:MAG: hypothetical protein ABEH77_09260 [Halobacteriaceae archaeon]